MTIVVGYIPRPEGLAAVDAAIVEAVRRGERLIVVNTGHHGDNTDPSYAAPQDLDALDAQLTARGVEHEIRQPNLGRAPADELLDAADSVQATLIVIGLRRRSPITMSVAPTSAAASSSSSAGARPRFGWRISCSTPRAVSCPSSASRSCGAA